MSNPRNPFSQAETKSNKQLLNSEARRQQNTGSLWVLKFIELGLFLVLIFTGFRGLQTLNRLNRVTLETWRLPTITPTPLIRPVLLPSGHATTTTPYIFVTRINNVHGYPRTSENIPANVSVPTAVPEFATRIQIPAIDVDAPVVLGVESEQLKKGVGQVVGSANPGEKGNLVLSAHNDIYGELFRYLDQLKPGDQFTIYTNLRAYTYVVIGRELVEPTRVNVMAPTPDATATLISCYPYLIDTMRIIVKAKLAES